MSNSLQFYYCSKRTREEQLRGDGGPADLKKTKGQGHEHLQVLHRHAYMYGTETLATKTTGYEKIARVTRTDRRRMVELREVTGVQRSLTERLVRSILQWAGHVERRRYVIFKSEGVLK